MSFLLKSPRLVSGLAGFTSRAKFAFRKRKIISSNWENSSKVNQTFVRCCALAPENKASEDIQKNFSETLYQKSISQVYFDVRFKGYIFREDFNNAWYTLQSSTDFTPEQIEVLIKSCGHKLPLEPASEKLKLVKEVWDSLDYLGVKKTINHYHALLDVYNELEHNFSTKDFLTDLEKQGMSPNLLTYKKLLYALSIQGKITNVQDLLEHMKMHSVSIDDGVFNSLILGYSLQGNFTSACGILELMKERGLMLSSESYVNLALGYAKWGDIDKVKEIVDEFKTKVRFSTTDFLEIAYTFAVNNHSEHLSTVLDMIKLKKNFPILSTKVVHRLLHQKLDKEALMVFELGDKIGSIGVVQEPIQMFLDHYVRFRKPAEIINITKIFEEKGWSPIALAYCIKETLIRKNIPHCLDFLHTLKTQGYPIRVHYFYPILVKSHRFGNEEVFKIMRHMYKNNVPFGREATKALNKFYDFLPGTELEDLAKLKNVGMREGLAAWKILDILLIRQNINKAVKLVSISEIAYPAIFLPVSMASAFRAHQSEYKKFFHIFYHLIHNLKANKTKRRINSKIHAVEYEQFLVEIAEACDKTFNLRIMKEMLKKKIPISADAAVIISKKFSCPETNHLISKLTSADLEIEFDQNLLRRLLKIRVPEIVNEISEKNGGKRDWSELQEALEKHVSVPDATNIFQDLAKQTEFSKNISHQHIVKRLLTYASVKGDVANTEIIYRIGTKKGFIKAENYNPCVTAHLVSGNLENAVQSYYEGLKAHKKLNILETLLNEIKSKKKLLLLDDLNASISKVYDEKFAATQLLVRFAKLKCYREMRIILESKTEIISPLFNSLCRTLLREKNLNSFEILESVSRKTTKLNLKILYQRLLKLYEFEGNLKKILKLYVSLERDDTMNDDFQNIFFECLKNWTHYVPESLKNVFQCVLEDCKARKPLKNLETISYIENIQNAWTEDGKSSFNNKNKEISNLSDITLLSCFCLIQAGKLDEYFTILREKISEKGPNTAKKYFFCYKLVPHMMKEKKYLKEYEELAGMCKSSVLWEKYIKLCLRLGNIQGVKRTLEKLHPYQVKFCLKDVSIEDCVGVIENTDYHRQMGKQIAVFYTELIDRCKNENKLEMMNMYYKKAKKYKVDDFMRNFC